MATINTRFGEVEYDPEKVVRFPQGLIGFEWLRDFVVMPNEVEGPLFWIQSVEEGDIAFVLTDPNNFFPDYALQPEPHECEVLEISTDDDCFVLSVVTVHTDRSVTLNLQAPILYAPDTQKAMQVILEGTDYKTRTPLPLVAPKMDQQGNVEESAQVTPLTSS